MRVNLVAAIVVAPFLWAFTSGAPLFRAAMESAVAVFFAITALELARPRLQTRGRAWLLLSTYVVITLLAEMFVGFISGPSLAATAALLIACVFLGHRVAFGVTGFLLASTAGIGWAAVSQRLPWHYPAIDVRMNDASAWVHTMVFAIVLLAFMGTMLSSIVGRMTAAVRHNARLCREARSAVRTRDDFLSIASHELRTPIAALKLSAAGITSGRIPATPRNVKRTLELVDRNVDRLNRLVGQLLDVSHIEATRLELELSQVDLTALVREVVDMFGKAGKGDAISLDLEPAVRGRWDRDRLEQVVMNLVSNALKFGGEKPIEVSLRRRKARAQLVVRDHGAGIPSDEIPFVFDRFFRGEARRGAGLGLGLFITRSIVEALSGTISVENIAGDGAAFTVELPLSGPEAADQAAKEQGT